MTEWIKAVAADLRKGDVFRSVSEDRASRVTARWVEDDEVKLFSRDASTDQPEGRWALRPGSPVLIRR